MKKREIEAKNFMSCIDAGCCCCFVWGTKKWIPLITIFNKVYIKTGFLHEITLFPGEHTSIAVIVMVVVSIWYFIFGKLRHFYTPSWCMVDIHLTNHFKWASHSSILKLRSTLFVMNILHILYAHTHTHSLSHHCSVCVSLYLFSFYVRFSILVTIENKKNFTMNGELI